MCLIQDDKQVNKCKNYKEFGYFCVPSWQCNTTTNTIIQDGKGLAGVGIRSRDIDCKTGIFVIGKTFYSSVWHQFLTQ